MLKIKYIEQFKAGEPYIIIAGTKEDFISAAHYFKVKHGAFLNDSTIMESYGLNNLEDSSLVITAEECNDIADRFMRVVSTGEPQHIYYDTVALGNIEIIISYLEYDKLFQQDSSPE